MKKVNSTLSPIQIYTHTPDISPKSPFQPDTSPIKPNPFAPSPNSEGHSASCSPRPGPFLPSKNDDDGDGTHTSHRTRTEPVAHCTYGDWNGPPRPALGRDGGRPHAGLRPRQAPQVRLLLALVLVVVVGSGRRRGGHRAGGDAQHHHRPAAVALGPVIAWRRVELRAVLPGQRAGLPVRSRYHAQGGRLEEPSPEIQDGRLRGRGGRRAEKPNRVRLGGDQFIGPMNSQDTKTAK